MTDRFHWDYSMQEKGNGNTVYGNLMQFGWASVDCTWQYMYICTDLYHIYRCRGVEIDFIRYNTFHYYQLRKQDCQYKLFVRKMHLLVLYPIRTVMERADTQFKHIQRIRD